MNILVDGQTLQSPEVNRGIGVYFKNVLNHIVKLSFTHNWYITVGCKESLQVLDPWVASRVIPIENAIFAPSSDYSRTEAYTRALEQIVKEKRIDVFWAPNPLMVNVLFLARSLKCRMFATLYDIIPAIMPVKEWSNEVRQEYQRRLSYLKGEDMSLLCISNATKTDFECYISKRKGVFITLLAADSRKFYRKRQNTGSGSAQIVFTGGFDYRKNINGAVQAFARMCQKYQGNPLVEKAGLSIVCSASEENKQKLYQVTKELNVSGRVVLTGFIPDHELAELYQKCDVFFFPSFYEGFGLPIVEAMLGGAYVLSADNSSLPEVCGGHALLCNANDIEDMADRLMEALINAAQESLDEKHRRQEYALSFSWERTAQETLNLFEQETHRFPKRKIAIVTPWPKQNTGIANYIYQMLPSLSEYFDIDIFVDNTVVSKEKMLPNLYGKLYMIDQLDQHYKEYDKILYQIGNSSDYHTGIYQKLIQYGGIAEIHDFVLHPFFYHAYFLNRKYEVYQKALEDGYGASGLEHYRKVRDKLCAPDNEKYPMSHSVANVSQAVIFHNHWSKQQINDKNVYIIPHSCFDKMKMEESEKEKRKLQLKERINYDGEMIVGCFGFVNENKRPGILLKAVENLLLQNYAVKAVFWGKMNYTGLWETLSENIKDHIAITGYLEKEDYETALDLTDIVVNLRYPSMGESSGTLCEALKYGKPVLVSDLNQYQEYPDEVCWKVPVGNNEVQTLTDMLKYLIDHPKVRSALGENARNYADIVLSPKKIAKMYQEIINEVISQNDKKR